MREIGGFANLPVQPVVTHPFTITGDAACQTQVRVRVDPHQSCAPTGDVRVPRSDAFDHEQFGRGHGDPLGKPTGVPVVTVVATRVSRGQWSDEVVAKPRSHGPRATLPAVVHVVEMHETYVDRLVGRDGCDHLAERGLAGTGGSIDTDQASSAEEGRLFGGMRQGVRRVLLAQLIPRLRSISSMSAMSSSTGGVARPVGVLAPVAGRALPVDEDEDAP